MESECVRGKGTVYHRVVRSVFMFPVWWDDVDIPMDIAIQMMQLGVDIVMYIDIVMTDDVAAARISRVICCKEDSILTPLPGPFALLGVG